MCGDSENQHASKCDTMTKTTCGSDGPSSGPPQDMCFSAKIKVKSPDGKVHDAEMRNCSSSMFCNYMCAAMNQTGDIVDCSVNCCQGSLCNSKEDTPTVYSNGVAMAASVALVISLAFVLIDRF